MVSLGDVFTSFSFAQSAESIRKTVGEEWFSKFAKNVKPVFYSKSAQGRGWVASGEFPIMLMSHGMNAKILKDQKIEVRLVFPKEGLLLMPDTPVILKRAAHPAVARLFIDFVRSEKGVKAVKASGAELFFGRPGIKSSDPELFPSWEDVKVIPMDWDVDGSENQVKHIRQIVKAAGVGRSH
jgi:ABC-type Fe3+ transport system substrate-binding protein